MQVTLAELLLRRKELAGKVEQTRQIQNAAVYETKVKRQKVTEDLDDILASVPKLTLSQVTAEHDHYARALRQVDSRIQQANWSVKVEVDPASMMSFDELQEARAHARAAVQPATPQAGDAK